MSAKDQRTRKEARDLAIKINELFESTAGETNMNKAEKAIIARLFRLLPEINNYAKGETHCVTVGAEFWRDFDHMAEGHCMRKTEKVGNMLRRLEHPRGSCEECSNKGLLKVPT